MTFKKVDSTKNQKTLSTDTTKCIFHLFFLFTLLILPHKTLSQPAPPRETRGDQVPARPTESELSNRDIQRLLRRSYGNYQSTIQDIERLQIPFHTQMLNRDNAMSGPAYESRISSHLMQLEELRAVIEMFSPMIDQDIDYTILREPRIRPEVAPHITYYRYFAASTLSDYFHTSQRLDINFENIHRSNNSNHNGYPTDPLPTQRNRLCSVGGFITTAQVPNNTPANDNNLLNRFNHWVDLECRSPTEVQLQLNGRPLRLRCGPPNNTNNNLEHVFNGMRMCDPMLFGFYPFAPTDHSNRATAACHYPKNAIIGRSYTYSENILNIDRRDRRPISECEIVSRSLITQSLQGTTPLSEPRDLGLQMAARISLENEQLWQQKKSRIRQACQGLTRRDIEFDHCQSLLSRVDQIEQLRLNLQRLANDETNEADTQSND